MIDEKLQRNFQEENKYLQYVTHGLLSSLHIKFWGWLRNLAQQKIEQFKIKNIVSLKTTQFRYDFKKIK
jgi:hypothetical protein